MDTNVSYLFDLVLSIFSLLLGCLSILFAIISRKDRILFVGTFMFFLLTAGRIWSDYVYFRVSVDGHRYEGNIFFVLMVIAAALVIIGGFPAFKRKLSTLFVVDKRDNNNTYSQTDKPLRIRRVNIPSNEASDGK